MTHEKTEEKYDARKEEPGGQRGEGRGASISLRASIDAVWL